MRTLLSVTLFAALLTACGPIEQPDDAASLGQSLAITHSYDLAGHMPPRLAIMLSMSWFGVGSSDRNGTVAGSQLDPTYGNWLHGTEYLPTSSACTSYTGTVCVAGSTPGGCVNGERNIASRYRPLAGIYSASGRDTESQRRVDLMLSTLTPTCNQGARIDAWAVQINQVEFTSKYPSHHQANTDDYAWRAYQTFLSRADANGLTSVILPGYDSTWYFHFGDGSSLGSLKPGKCDDSSGNPKQNCMNAIRDDLVDMLDEGASHPSALRINGKPLVQLYVDTQFMTPAQWKSTLDAARNMTHNARTGLARTPIDFYTVATAGPAYFTAFDALTPWIHTEQWKSFSSSGANQPYTHALQWVKARHDALIDACAAGVAGNPGCVVFGGVNPGFDDFTKQWGCPCQERRIPDPVLDGYPPRHPDLMRAHFDYFEGCKSGTSCTSKHASYDFKGMLMMTWDDFTEGSLFEPNVEEGTEKLVALRQGLGVLFGDISSANGDPAGDAALDARWTGFGQARSCDNSVVNVAPPLTLICPKGVTVSGTATALGTANPLAHATLTLAGKTVTTDSSGHFSFSAVAAGAYTLSASASGFLPRDYPVMVGSSALAQNVQLSTAGKISGSVKNESGAPLPGAMVTIAGGQLPTSKSALSDANGAYDQGWVPVTTPATLYTVTCALSGYTSQSFSVAVSAGAITTVGCTLTNQGTLSGTVSNLQSGGTIASATLALSNGASATSNGSGAFSFGALPLGDYTLSASAPGFLARQYNVSVTGGATSQSVQLSTSGKIVGTVRGPNGAAVAGATIRLRGGLLPVDVSVSSSSSGSYDSGWLPSSSPATTYTVTCSKSGYANGTVSAVTISAGVSTHVDCKL